MKRREMLASLPLVALSGCMQHYSSDPGHAKVTSTAFNQGDVLPKRYRCDGGESSPPLSFTYPYASAGHDYPDKTWAVILQSTPPPKPPKTSQTHVKPLTHWMIWNIPVKRDNNNIPYGSLPAAILAGKTVSSLNGATQGRNSFGTYRYDLGCPISEKRLLGFNIFTLSDRLDVNIDIDPQKLIDKMYNTSLVSVGSTQAIIDPTVSGQSSTTGRNTTSQ